MYPLTSSINFGDKKNNDITYKQSGDFLDEFNLPDDFQFEID